jgi:hypothetical protein
VLLPEGYVEVNHRKTRTLSPGHPVAGAKADTQSTIHVRRKIQAQETRPNNQKDQKISSVSFLNLYSVARRTELKKVKD